MPALTASSRLVKKAWERQRAQCNSMKNSMEAFLCFAFVVLSAIGPILFDWARHEYEFQNHVWLGEATSWRHFPLPYPSAGLRCLGH